MIVIGYSGTLSYYNPEERIKKYDNVNPLGIYRHNFSLSNTRSPYFLFKGIEKLKSLDEKLSEKMKVVLWGNIDERNVVLINKLYIDDIVEISGVVPKDESIEKLESCDVLYLPLEKPAEDHKTLFIPGKVFEYISLKKPILVFDKDSDCSDIIKKTGLGIFANNDNVDDITEVLSNIINTDLLNTIKSDELYISSLSFSNRAKDMANIFSKLLGK